MRLKAKYATSDSHWSGSPNEIIYNLPAATKGRINEEAYSDLTGIPIDRKKVGGHRGDFPNKTQAKLCCIKSDGNFILNHLTQEDDHFVITCVEPRRITLLEFTRDQLWSLKPTKQNGSGDYILVTSLDALMSVKPVVIEQQTID